MPTPLPVSNNAPDFRLYHSNALDVLASLLANALRQPAPGQPLLAPDIVLIPQVAMRRWLQASLAHTHGIAANLEFLTPGEFVSRALAANLGKASDELDTTGLHWRLYAALRDRAVLAQPALATFADALTGNDPVKPWALAGELAGVFEKYQAWRRDWLLGWDNGDAPDDAQAVLWRAVVGGRSHRAQRIHAYLARFETGTALPVGLPSRLFAFATLNISPDVLRVLATQARVGTLHFYVPSPVEGYWGDLQSLRARLLAGADTATGMDDMTDDDNPLLRDWGAAGRDFMALLGGYDIVQPAGEIDVHVDPATRPTVGLLQRLQSDIYHRNARPGLPLRKGVDRDDGSVQFHACHTRLRELQVLHSRLRGLLEDPRFEPPLQPRDIAVLAPDIDAYAPYLEAVFGSHNPEAGNAIPYALADASPLADEPLADVFLRLLALPVARFGLEEILELLATPVLADANGLSANAIERLRGWLGQAGARWGLDAAHRAQLGAPEDAAYTWQFALDRLLLGHASGDDAAILSTDGQVVAPWSALEGSALDALATLSRLLQVLARAARVLGEAQPPAQWRERLLALLEDVLPQPPASVAGQRALDRLRKLIDDFAQQANKAAFDAPVPAEVVRAHFTAALGDADTRAPLLTGGVSVARMVPMRLLPFRVICLLGMNDGDFPRRDPAAGLSKLAAEIAGGKRLPGDRSTREDDRFLFLQLFTAAQEVFYLSWLGADPRDGSRREPSVLVTELLAAAAAQHAAIETDAETDAETAPIEEQLVLRHPLQPFAQAAFGAHDNAGNPDTRVFSYDAHWQPAAGSVSAARQPLPPWLAADASLAPQEGGTALDATPDAEPTLALDTLRRFLQDPAKQFLRERMQLRLPELEARTADLEPLQAPAAGLQRSVLQRAVFEQLLTSDNSDAHLALLRARGLLPSGPLGRRVLQDMTREIAPYAKAYTQWRGDAQPATLPLSVMIDGVRVHGRLAEVLPGGVTRLRFGKPSGRSAIRNGLDWLLLCAAGQDTPFMEFHDNGSGGLGPHPRPALPQADAIAALRRLLALHRDGLRQPLPFAPYSSWKLFNAKTTDNGVRDAANQWRGNFRGWAEGQSEALRLALRGRDPFANLEALREFARIAGVVFGTLNTGTPTLFQIDASMLPAAFDRDDEEGEYDGGEDAA